MDGRRVPMVWVTSGLQRELGRWATPNGVECQRVLGAVTLRSDGGDGCDGAVLEMVDERSWSGGQRRRGGGREDLTDQKLFRVLSFALAKRRRKEKSEKIGSGGDRDRYGGPHVRLGART